jgi:hypothetical protein
MSVANDDVSAALDSVLNDVEPQTTTESAPEVKTEDVASKAVEEALKSTPDTQTDATGKTVPYDRFSEVVAQKNAASERLQALEAQYTSATEREDGLRERMAGLEQEHSVLEAIRDLGRDDRYSDAVSKIDRALQGIEDDVEAATTTEDGKDVVDNSALLRAEQAFSEKTEELESLVNDQRVEGLWDKSQDYASAMLDSLPEEYTDTDRSRLSRMWTPRVDWNSIEEGGAESIPENLNGSFAELIKEYGAPQGAVAQTARDEVTQSIPEEARPSTPEAIVEGVMEKNWSETNEDGQAVLGDDEFAADVAKLLRATRTG